MFKIIKINYKLLFSNKVSLSYILIYCFLCGALLPVFFADNYYTLIVVLIFSYSVQISPKLFALEKEENTFETLLSSPIDMKSIYVGKSLYCFSVIMIMFYASYIMTFIISLFVSEFRSLFQIKECITSVILLPMTVLTLAFHGAYISLKSNDSRACSLTMIFVSILYSIIPITLFAVIPMDNIIFIILVFLYVLLNVFIYIFIWNKVKKYFNKSLVFLLLRRSI